MEGAPPCLNTNRDHIMKDHLDMGSPVHWALLAVILLRFLRIHKSYIPTYIHTCIHTYIHTYKTLVTMCRHLDSSNSFTMLIAFFTLLK